MGDIIASRIIISIFFIIVVLGCDSDNSIVGAYKSERPSKVEYATFWITKGAIRSISGQELKLKSDSSYIYKTCGHIITGSWKVDDDRLTLIQESKRWKSDSLNEVDYPFGKEPQGYFDFDIEGDEMVSIFQSSSDGRRMINKLSK